MSRVPSNTVGALLIEAWAPYITPDLEDYANTIGSMFQDVDDLVDLLGEENGWSALLDPSTCPEAALPYLAQYMGERLPAGLTDVSLKRQWITDHPNLYRGTLVSILLAAQRSLTGTRIVMYKERSGGGANPEDYFQIRTYASQTPNPNQVIRDIYSALPADIQLDYATSSGQTYASIISMQWSAVMSTYASWSLVLGTLSGGNTWERPRPIP